MAPLAPLGLVLGACLALILPAAARAEQGFGVPPMEWPGEARVAQGGDWLLGVPEGVPLPAALRRHGVRHVRPGTLAVPAAAARRVGEALADRGLLRYAEPDVRVRRTSVAEAQPSGWARGAVVPPSLAWPRGGPEIGVIDAFVDPSHPDLAGKVRFVNATSASRIEDAHGTAVASVAAAMANGSGLLGVMPTAAVASYGMPEPSDCSDLAAAIDEMTRIERLEILNISMGTTAHCFTLYLEVQQAYGAGTLIVASSGNEFFEGNPVVFPAAYPHVVSVAALERDHSPAEFSSSNAGVDLAAPGVDVPVASPPGFDTEDGAADGYTTADGTSFASPMVAGAASWVWSLRPHLEVGQVADVLRLSARDVGRRHWDEDTGWGLLDVGAALREPAPPNDYGEPNDDISMVDGRVFAGADPFLWRGHGRKSLRAWADQWEDPADVYRIRLPRRSRVRILLRPAYGDPDLEVYDQGARSLGRRRWRVCSSRAPAGRTDACTLRWNGRRARTAYVVVYVTGETLDSRYRLALRRLRYR